MASNKGISPAGAGAIGVVAGAAVGAAAVILSEEKNRKAIGKEFKKIENKVEDMAEGAKGKAEEVTAQGEKKVEEVKEVIKK